MEFGLCHEAPTEELARQLADAGANYYEPTVASGIMASEPRRFDEEITEWQRGPLRPGAANWLLPQSLAVTGQKVDRAAVNAYLTEAFRRLRALRIPVVVFGSAPSRKVPSGYPVNEAYDDMERFLRDAIQEAQGQVAIGIEPIVRPQPAVFESFSATLSFLTTRKLAGQVGIALDSYHLWQAGESAKDLRGHESHIVHLHLSGPTREPLEENDLVAVSEILDTVLEAGYQGRCSFECKWTDPAEDFARCATLIDRWR